MKKIYFFVALCLLASTNLYMKCYEDFSDEERPYNFFRGMKSSMNFAVDGGSDSLCLCKMTADSVNDVKFLWKITGATDYDWHSAKVKETAIAPDENDSTRMDGGWFKVEKLEEKPDSIWVDSFLKIVVEKNTSGKNRHAEVHIYHPASQSSACLDIYQDSK